MKIYLKTDNKFKNIKELIAFGYCDYKFVETYYDLECTKRQCHKASRSFDDLLLICRTYFPETTEKELAKAIFILGESIGLRPEFCYDIKKVVFNSVKSRTKFPMDCFIYGHESGLKGNGEYSWDDIKELSNT